MMTLSDTLPKLHLFGEVAQSMIDDCQTLLETAPLTDLQRSDITAICESSHLFQDYARHNLPVAHSDIHDVGVIRHQLKNHLNIVVGFSQLMTRDLPDNLLMHMAIVRRIHHKASRLLVAVDRIRD